MCCKYRKSLCHSEDPAQPNERKGKKKKKKILRSRNSNGQIRTKIQTQAVECKSKSKCSPLVSRWGRLYLVEGTATGAQPSLPTLYGPRLGSGRSRAPESSVPIAVRLGVPGGPSPAQPLPLTWLLDLQTCWAGLGLRPEDNGKRAAISLVHSGLCSKVHSLEEPALG